MTLLDILHPMHVLDFLLMRKYGYVIATIYPAAAISV